MSNKTMSIPEKLAGHKVISHRRVVWGDMDAMRHVNNTKYFYYCETARTDFLQEMDPNMSETAPELQKVGVALAETSCRFKVALTYPDDIQIGTVVSDISDNEFILQHHIFSTKMDCVAAIAKARMVYYDFEKRQRSNIPDPVLAFLKEHQLS